MAKENAAPIPQALLARYLDARSKAAEWAQIERDARSEIEKIMGDNEFATVRGSTVITWKHGKVSQFQAAKLKADHPELYASYTELKPQRRFVPVDQA